MSFLRHFIKGTETKRCRSCKQMNKFVVVIVLVSMATISTGQTVKNEHHIQAQRGLIYKYFEAPTYKAVQNTSQVICVTCDTDYVDEQVPSSQQDLPLIILPLLVFFGFLFVICAKCIDWCKEDIKIDIHKGILNSATASPHLFKGMKLDSVGFLDTSSVDTNNCEYINNLLDERLIPTQVNRINEHYKITAPSRPLFPEFDRELKRHCKNGRIMQKQLTDNSPSHIMPGQLRKQTRRVAKTLTTEMETGSLSQNANEVLEMEPTENNMTSKTHMANESVDMDSDNLSESSDIRNNNVSSSSMLQEFNSSDSPDFYQRVNKTSSLTQIKNDDTEKFQVRVDIIPTTLKQCHFITNSIYEETFETAIRSNNSLAYYNSLESSLGSQLQLSDHINMNTDNGMPFPKRAIVGEPNHVIIAIDDDENDQIRRYNIKVENFVEKENVTQI